MTSRPEICGDDRATREERCKAMHSTPPSSTIATPTPRMPFGKHKGCLLTDLPAEYLLWIGCLPDLRQPLLGAILREMGRRIVAMDQQAAHDGEAVGR
jgi:uncharacterized protein (DUF3820 family)